MARWEGNARDRLMSAALELFAEHGYDGVTVAQIADRAGLTERTFFRQFADKRDVLFPDQEAFEAMFLRGLEDSDATAPMDLVMAAIGGVSDFFSAERHAWSRARQAVLVATPTLQERERAKLAGVAAALADALVARGVARAVASLATDTGLTVFHTAFQAWLADDETRSMAEIQRDVLADLRGLVG